MRFTRATSIALLCTGLGLGAQTETDNGSVRQLSRQECVEMALRQNTSLEIAKYGPGDSLLTLDASYGAYEPNFSIGLQKSSNKESPRFNPVTSQTSEESDVTVDSLRPGVSGVLPFGTTYDFFAGFEHRTGTAGGFPLDSYQSIAGVNLTQPLLRDFWIDATRLNIKVNKTMVESAQFQLELDTLETVRSVEMAYYDLIAAIDTVASWDSAVAVSQQFLDETKKKVEVGTLAPLEEKRAASALAGNKSSLIDARRQVRFSENRLKGLFSANYESWFGVRIEPTDKVVAVPEQFDLVESALTAVKRRPDYNLLVKQAEISGIRVGYFKNQLFPRLDLRGGYGRLGVQNASGLGGTGFSGSLGEIREGDNPNHRVGVTLSFPWSFKRERNEYKLARNAQEIDALRLRVKHDSLLMDLENAIDSVRASFERVASTRESREFAQEALDAGQKKLVQGTVTSFEVLELQSDLVDARTSEISALADYQKDLIEVYYSEGTLLDRRQVTIEFDE